MADDADRAAELQEREMAALLDRHRRRLPPPVVPSATRMADVLDKLPKGET